MESLIMRLAGYLLVLLLSLSAAGRQTSVLPSHSQQRTDEDPALLSSMLTRGLRSDKEKVRAIFSWITENISYHRPSARSSKWKDQNLGYQAEEDTGAITPLTERIARKVLKDRSTHCEGYARLFTSLCDHAGITSTIITGYARAGNGSRFKSNHSWNAVWVDSSWHLLDATWAAGHITYYSNEFVRNFSDHYFFTRPEIFAIDHYPDDLRWTLMDNPPAIDEFRKNPFRQRSFGKYMITAFSPSKGIVEAFVGDTIRFQIRTNNGRFNNAIAPDSLWEPSSRLFDRVWTYIEPLSTNNSRVEYEYVVTSDKIEWLHLIYNDDAVLRYRLRIRQPGNATAATQSTSNAENKLY